MPFRDSTLRLVVIVFATFVMVRCASLSVVPNATAPAPAQAPSHSNPSHSVPEQGGSAHGQPDPNNYMDLAECKNGNVPEEICALYRSLVTALSQRKRDPLTGAKLFEVTGQEADGERFCYDLAPLLKAMSQKHPDRELNSKHLENRRYCEKACVPFEEDTLKTRVRPICKVLLWGFRTELQAEVEGEVQDPAKQAAKVMMAPMLPPIGGGGQVEEKDHANANPVQPTAPAQSNITSPENVAKSSPAKKAEADQTKDTVAVVSPAEKSSTPTNPVIPPAAADKSLLEEDQNQDQDFNELRNQENLKDANGDGLQNNQPEEDEDDEDGTDSYLPPNMPETSENEQPAPKFYQEPFDTRKTDSGGRVIVDDQEADAAVHVERVEQEDPFFDQDDSNFFSYFLFMMFVCILCYVAYHNKSKLLALVVEGRRSNSGRAGFSKGRKHTAAYRKLDSNLEEAITSNAAASSRSTSQIIY